MLYDRAICADIMLYDKMYTRISRMYEILHTRHYTCSLPAPSPLQQCTVCKYVTECNKMFLKITGLFCKRALYKRLYSAKETFNLKEPTNRSHRIRGITHAVCQRLPLSNCIRCANMSRYVTKCTQECRGCMRSCTMGWLRLVGSFKWQVSFAKEPYKRDYILQKRTIIWRSLVILATPCEALHMQFASAYM